METHESRWTRTAMLVVLGAVIGSGCATRPAAGESRRDEQPDSPDPIVRPVEGDLVRVDWNGIRLTDFVQGIARYSGRVIVYDRRQLVKKPPVNLARAVEVPSSGVFSLAESVLAGMQLACVEVSIRRSERGTAAFTRLVPRPESSSQRNAFLISGLADSWSRVDLPFMVVAGPEPQARAVRRALLELLEAEDHPVATPDSARPVLSALPPFSSPYPRCAR
ncbi:MAG: hypothetical protein IT452_02855 [Planctomycetia bacterium]|nr:hypothetical protein [Planctomycetia bacterium]